MRDALVGRGVRLQPQLVLARVAATFGVLRILVAGVPDARQQIGWTREKEFEVPNNFLRDIENVCICLGGIPVPGVISMDFASNSRRNPKYYGFYTTI